MVSGVGACVANEACLDGNESMAATWPLFPAEKRGVRTTLDVHHVTGVARAVGSGRQLQPGRLHLATQWAAFPVADGGIDSGPMLWNVLAAPVEVGETNLAS